MKVKVTTWQVSTLYKLKDKINEQPVYQRGEVWSKRKKSILIDSMLRGIDIPKIYLRKLATGAHEYEVADGQQRLTAIFNFLEDKVDLLDDEEKGLVMNMIDKVYVGGYKFSGLPQNLQDKLTSYDVTVAVIEDATNQEIRTLFGRLQEGDPLVPAEKRNALISTIGALIDNFAINHDFFTRSRIPANRFKRQDYLTHGLALVLLGNKDALKADLLFNMYLNKSIVINAGLQKTIAEILDFMGEVDSLSRYRIYKKYHFIDIFNYLYQNHSMIGKINPTKFAEKYDAFEKDRLQYYSNPTVLIANKKATHYETELFEYLTAFKTEGALPHSITKRYNALSNQFKDLL